MSPVFRPVTRVTIRVGAFVLPLPLRLGLRIP